VWANRILVVDDSDDGREMLCSLLHNEGFTTVEAVNGQEALDILNSEEGPPALIVLDLQMPVMSGWELLTILRSSRRFASIPVFIASGQCEAEQLMKKPVVAFFRRPLDLVRFLSKVKEVA
jgi:two-component system OmpR family response regulator